MTRPTASRSTASRRTVPSLFLLLLSLLCLCASVGGERDTGNLEERQLRVGTGFRSRLGLIAEVAVNGAVPFSDPDSYQSRALDYVTDTRGLTSATIEFKTYFALACLYLASSGVHNKRTMADFPHLAQLPGWISSDFWLDATVSYCQWWGITCDSNGQVSRIELFATRMFGIFAPEVELLAPSLQVIDLFNNYYLVTEPTSGNDWIPQLTNLRELYFGTTSFEYEGVPEFLGKLSLLEQLDISNSFYTEGPIRGKAFQGLDNLFYLDMADNIYTTPVPPQVASLPSLTYLYLDNVLFINGATQSLDFITRMPSLREAWMDFTTFVGGLPTELGNIATLESLSLSFCGLTGTIPLELSRTSLDRLWLYQNSLIGTIPTELGMLTRMKFLYLEGNLLQGTMPAQICSNRDPFGLITELGADCDNTGTASSIVCNVGCCTCCGGIQCNDFAV